MKIIRNHQLSGRFKYAITRASVIFLTGLLAACSDTGPSELINEAQNKAQALASESGANPVDVIPEIAAASATAGQTTTAVNAPTDNTTSTDSSTSLTVATNTDTTDIATNSNTPSIEVGNNTSIVSVTNSANTNTENTVEAAENSYSSSSSPDFTATILSDAIEISWSGDDRAKGYNVYKQGDYHATVFGLTYIDDELSASEIEYEIVAFDHDENFFDVATGLTVEVENFEQAPDNQSQVDNTSSESTFIPTQVSENSEGQVDAIEPSLGAAEESSSSSSQAQVDTASAETEESSSNGSQGQVDTASAETENTDTDEVQASKESTESSSVSNTNTSFTSVTTPGFEGQVLDNAIRISWNEDADARGYNVYRQAAYYTTVFDTEFIDTDVYDGDYYYEIQAFDYDEQLYYIATGLTVTASTFGRTDPDAPQANEQLLSDYELVFSDEFNLLTLDQSKWNTSFIWGPDLVINHEEQYYVDINNEPDFGFNPFTFDGGNLTINTIETPSELAGKAQNQPYLSGIITSYDAFKFTYGYIETRAKVTHGRGYWPAFWLLNAYYGDADPEIDIMEFIGHNQDVVYHTYHYFDENDSLVSSPSVSVPGTDYTADFHTYGVEWMPGILIFYINGIETYRIEDPNVSNQQMYVLANQAVGGWWAGSPDESTPFPGKFIIDYIRVYQRITPYQDLQFDYQEGELLKDNQGTNDSLPNKRPTLEQWPEGYLSR